MPIDRAHLSNATELALTGAMVAPLSLPFLTHNVAQHPDSLWVATAAGVGGTVSGLTAYAVGIGLSRLLRVPVDLGKSVNRGGAVVALLCIGSMAAGSYLSTTRALNALPAGAKSVQVPMAKP